MFPTYDDKTAPPDADRAPVNVTPSANVRAPTLADAPAELGAGAAA